MQAHRKGGGLGGATAPPPVFSRTVNPISTRGSRLCPPQYYEPPGFSDLATALQMPLGFQIRVGKQ